MSNWIKPYKTSNFSSGFNIEKLRSEVGSSGIDQGLLEIVDLATRIDVIFESELNADDKNELTTIFDNHDGSSIAGLEYKESDAESETTATSYEEKVNLTTSSLLSGDYMIRYCAEATITSGFKTVDVRVDLDDAEELAELKFDSQDDVEYMPLSGFKKKTLSSGVHTIDIDFRSGGTPENAKIRRARVSIEKV